MKKSILSLLVFAFAASPSLANRVDDAANAGFLLPRACAGLQSPLLNIWGDVLVQRFTSFQNAEGTLVAAAADAQTKIQAYSDYCPLYAQNMNSPTLLTEMRKRMKSAEDAATKVAKQNLSLSNAGNVITTKYAATFPDSSCFQSVPKDVAKADSINSSVMTSMGNAEQLCANASSNTNSK